MILKIPKAVYDEWKAQSESLVDFNEEFVSPCSMAPSGCETTRKPNQPRIGFINLEYDARMAGE